MYKLCKNPKIEPVGTGKIMVVFGVPSKIEDSGKPFMEPYQQYLFAVLRYLGLAEKDITATHAIQCYQEIVSPKAIEGCHYRLKQRILEAQPRLVILCDEWALKTLYYTKNSGRFSFTSYEKFTGWAIPDQELKTIVLPIHPPHQAIMELERRRKMILKYRPDSKFKKPLYTDSFLTNNDNFQLYDRFITEEIKRGLSANFKEFEPVVEYTDDVTEAIKVLKYLITLDKVAFDTETTGIKPYREGHRIDCYSFSDGLKGYAFPHFEDERFLRVLKRFFTSSVKKVAHNMKFDNNWVKNFLGYEVQNLYMDTQNVAHILDNREGITSLKFQVFVRLGIIYDSEVDGFLKSAERNGNAINSIHLAPVQQKLEYAGKDAIFTYILSDIFEKQLKQTPFLQEGVDLFHEGALALGFMEDRGFLVDMIQLEKNRLELEKKSYELYDRIMKHSELSTWTGERFNPKSNKHLIQLFYDIHKYPIIKRTKTGEPSTDKSSLEDIADKGSELAIIINEFSLVNKLKDTFISGVAKESWNDILHPSFLLNSVASFRSSSSNPNFQNFPKADDYANKMIRSIFKPRPGYVLMDLDYKSLEAYIGCAIHKDSSMKDYLFNAEADMHADHAEDLFLCKKGDVDPKLFKEMRRRGKTFSFAMQYGSGALNVATTIWNQQLTPELKKWLATKKIDAFEQWLEHVKAQHKRYWEVRFKDLNEWRTETWKSYVATGVSLSNTGFRYVSFSNKNEICNYGIQGDGFHCLLYGIIQITKAIKEKNLLTRPLAQIHDSLILEVHESEIEEVKKLAKKCMVDDVLEKYDWIDMPLAIAGEIYRDNWAEVTEEITFGEE